MIQFATTKFICIYLWQGYLLRQGENGTVLAGPVCIASFPCSLGLRFSCIITEEGMGGNPIMFSGSFPGSFEF